MNDPDLRSLALEEDRVIQIKLSNMKEDLILELLPKDQADSKSAILEIRAGTGGDEAALFAADLLRMYQKYSDDQGWKLILISESFNELGGLKEVVASITSQSL